jgi:hypothetical protein
VRLPVHRNGPIGWTIAEKLDGEAWRDLGTGGPSEILRSWVAFSVPFAQLELQPGEPFKVALRLSRGEVALARYPGDGWLELNAPDDGFEAENWSV